MGYGSAQGFGVSLIARVVEQAKAAKAAAPAPTTSPVIAPPTGIANIWKVVTDAGRPTTIVPPAPMVEPRAVPVTPPPLVTVAGPPPVMTDYVVQMPPGSVAPAPGGTPGGNGSVADFFGTGGAAASGGSFLSSPVALVGLAVLGFLLLRRSGGTRKW